MNIFWSWQNDSDPRINRHFIRKALAKATQEAGDTLSLEDAERPELDHDTKDTPGMVEITNTILRKISQSAVFVADLTPVGTTAQGKALPNPNVLIELGWALSELGPDRIIGILNTAIGLPDDLPFDIRHRRALTYKLASESDKEARRVVCTRLTSDLAQAITTNLQQFAEDQAAATIIDGTPAKVEDPSIWASCIGRLDYTDTSNQSRSVTIPDGPRGYIRIIPSGWSRGLPLLTDIKNSRPGEEVWPVGEVTPSGDYGPCEHGFASIWWTGENEARSVSMWFDGTGEFWVIHGTAVVEWKQGKSRLIITSLLQGWRHNLRSAIKILGRLGASRAIKVEVGLVGIKGVMWPADMLSLSNPARKDQTIVDCQRQDWSDEEQLIFLCDVYNKIRDTFSLPCTTCCELQKILQEQ